MMDGIGGVAVVTGAASGIGRAAALKFAENSAAVGLIDLNSEGLAATQAAIAAAGGQAISVVAAAADPDAIHAALDRIEAALGPIAHAFNGAGVRGPIAGTVDLPAEDWRAVIDVNLTGTFVSMQAELRLMLAHGRGAIVNCASVLGIAGGGFGSAHYTASKHAVVGLTKTAALEAIGGGVRVNSIAPGFVATPMVLTMVPGGNDAARALFAGAIPQGRLADPDEIAEGIVWLCSDAADYVVGHNLVLDGGLIAGLRAVSRPPTPVLEASS